MFDVEIQGRVGIKTHVFVRFFDFQVSPAVIYVHKVTVRRPAAQSGQIEPGDVLVAIDGVAVADSTSLNRYGGIELVYSWYCSCYC